MSGTLKFMRRMSRHGQVQIVAFYPESSSAPVSNGCIANTGPHAALLRNKVLRSHLGYFLPVYSDLGVIPVCVCLFGTLTVPHYIFVIGRHRKHHRKLRKFTYPI